MPFPVGLFMSGIFSGGSLFFLMGLFVSSVFSTGSL